MLGQCEEGHTHGMIADQQGTYGKAGVSYLIIFIFDQKAFGVRVSCHDLMNFIFHIMYFISWEDTPLSTDNASKSFNLSVFYLCVKSSII